MPFVPLTLCLGILILMIPFSPFLIISIGRNTTYSITNKRVLITVSGWFNSSRSYTIANQTSMQVKSVRHGDGSGDVYFASCWDKTGDAEIAASATQNIGFIAISCQQISVVEHILHSTYFDQYGASSDIFETSHGQADRESIDLADKYSRGNSALDLLSNGRLFANISGSFPSHNPPFGGSSSLQKVQPGVPLLLRARNPLLHPVSQGIGCLWNHRARPLLHRSRARAG